MNPQKKYAFAILWMSLLGSSSVLSAQSSVLSSGQWFKVTISKAGVYKIDYNQLRSAGMDVDNIDPRTLKVYGNPGGMLPQAIASPRPLDLIENAILVQGEADGVFNASDFLLFFAEGADKQQLDVQREIMYYEHNLYADKNYVFITAGGSSGKRVVQSEAVTATTMVSTFQDVLHHELTSFNILKSGREWFGEKFENGIQKDITFEVEGIVSGSTLKLVSDVVAYSLEGSSFALAFNGNAIASQVVPQVPNSQYGIKARHKRDTFLLAADNVGAVNRASHILSYAFTRNGSSSAYGHLDFFSLTCTRALAVYGTQTRFRSLQSLQQPSSTFKIGKATATTQVWDITDATQVRNQAVVLTGSEVTAGSEVTFSTNTETPKEFIVFNQPLAVEAVTKIANQNLHGLAAVNMIIVTDAALEAEAERLAAHRRIHSGLSVEVVLNEEIYHEFSSGRPDVTAIRDFARLLKQNYPSDFQYLLLFGKGSYDYKNAIPNNVNRVLTYESRNSLSPLETFSSDDYFGMLEDNEGEWRECFNCNSTLDIGVGRIPIKQDEQAKFIVDKIIQYDTNHALAGDWQTRIAFVADDGDFNIHQAQADVLANFVETETNTVFKADKIYVDAFQQISRPAGQVAPEVNVTIKNSVEQGVLVLNYTGHGNEYQWSNEKILDELMVLGLENERLPFMVTATCEFGRHDDPQVTSVAEVALLREKYGVVGLVTTARPVNSSTNFDLNRAFYEAFLTKKNGSFQTLGEIFSATKNNSVTGVANRNFSLLGDPSMRLAFPEAGIAVETMVTNEQSDTLRALSSVTVAGSVLNAQGLVDESFQGKLLATVYDKSATFRTLGNENPPFAYQQWSSLIFKGEASVEEGKFEFNFIVPKNIAYSVGKGRADLFAVSTTQTAAGTTSIKVGGSASNPLSDAQPPQVSVFMNDSTFVSGGTVSSTVNLFVSLADENGISISSFGIGNDLTAVLDDVASFSLNDYYVAGINDYTKGFVTFPLQGLSAGKHRIKVLAWDTHNNPGEGYVDFYVSDGTSMLIEEFGNYPNPFQEESTLFFTHNAAGEDLVAEMVVYGPQGMQVLRESFQSSNSNYRVELGSLNRKDLPAGMYLAQLIVRSESTGKQAKSTAKLIIVN